MYKIMVGGKEFQFVRPTIEFVKSVVLKDYEKRLGEGLKTLFTDEGNEAFKKTWGEFCNDVFVRNWKWRLFGLPKELQLDNMEFSPEKNELKEVLTFFFVLLVGILKGLNGQSEPSEASKQAAEVG